jgi:hypothetical protein
LTDALDLTTPMGRAMAGLLAVFAEFEREILRERVRAGLAEARLQGKHLGRPPTAALQSGAVRKLCRAGVSKAEIARRLHIGRTSVRRDTLSLNGDRRRECARFPFAKGAINCNFAAFQLKNIAEKLKRFSFLVHYLMWNSWLVAREHGRQATMILPSFFGCLQRYHNCCSLVKNSAVNPRVSSCVARGDRRDLAVLFRATPSLDLL